MASEFPALLHQFEEGFGPRMKIDRKWNAILDWDYDDGGLDVLYSQIKSTLKDMKEMMERD